MKQREPGKVPVRGRMAPSLSQRLAPCDDPGMHPYARLALVLVPLLLDGAAPAVPTPKQIIDSAPPEAWQAVAPDDLLVMTLGSGQRVVMQLAPEFAPVHVANIRALARARWWDGAAIVRVQDNYVVQWARMPEGQKPPPGIAAHPPAEYDRPASGLALRPLGYTDAYAARAGFADGWPVGSDGARTWLVHCYGMVGVGRDLPPDTGSGEELYAVNGQAPRQLDRNIALVGRVVDGMDTLSALPRGTGALGFYADPAQRVPIATVRVAADLPAGEQPRVEAMRVDAPAFAAALGARATRRDPFFVRAAGAIDLCNAPVPVRVAPTGR